ncbi:YjbH domain-containing protein [Thermodesulfobacteriota bacterium]
MKIFFSHILLQFTIISVVLFFSETGSYSNDKPFNNSANWGGTGLMEIPNARILEDGVVRISGSQALPYRWISGGIGLLPGLEFSGRLTAITNYPAISPEYGSNKDKAFDLKYQLIPESKELPAIAIGINDFWGTRLFPSEYIVMSRQIYPFDITIGVGSKRLNGQSIPFINDKYSVFGGFVLTDFSLEPKSVKNYIYNSYKRQRKSA